MCAAHGRTEWSGRVAQKEPRRRPSDRVAAHDRHAVPAHDRVAVFVRASQLRLHVASLATGTRAKGGQGHTRNWHRGRHPAAQIDMHLPIAGGANCYG